MPRRNKPLTHPTRRPYATDDPSKRTYPSKRAAEIAIEQIHIYHPDVTLKAYQSPHDSLWRLTSN